MLLCQGDLDFIVKEQFSRGCRSDSAKCIELDLERKKIAMNSISPLLETLSVHMCSTVCGDEDSVSTWSDLLGYSINIFAGFLNLLPNFFGGSCAGTCQPCFQLFNQLFYISLKSYMLHEHALLNYRTCQLFTYSIYGIIQEAD